LLNVLLSSNLLNLLNLLNLRSLDLVFNFIIFDSFNLSRLSDVVGSFLSNVFGFLYGNVFGFFDGDLFLNGIEFDSRNVFSLVFNGLIFGIYFFSGDLFNNFSFNSFVLDNLSRNLFRDGFFNSFVFHSSSFDREIFDSGFSFDVLSGGLGGNNRLLNNSL